MVRYFVIASNLAIAMLACIFGMVSEDWPVFRGNAESQGVSQSDLAPPLKPLWEFEVPKGAFESTPIIVGDRVFIGDMDGELFCLQLSDGKVLWKAESESGYRASPAYREELVVIGDYDGWVHAFDAKTGKELWKYETGAPIDSGANFFEDLVLVTSEDGNLYALELRTGSLAWKYETGDQLQSSPTVARGQTFLGGCDGQLHCVDLTTGKAVGEKIPLGGPTGSTPAAFRDTIVLPTHGGPILGISIEKNKSIWKFEDSKRSPEVRSSPAIAHGMAYVTTRSRKLLALDLADGKLQWEATLRKQSESSPVVSGNRIYVGAIDGRLYAFDGTSGKELWVVELLGAFRGSPAVSGDRLVIASDKGTVFCFGPKAQ